MDLKSILGYADSSPFRSNPYLDINSPEGLITMENTGIDLVGVDNLGNKQKMKAYSKTPYKFRGNVIREIPVKRKGGKLSKAQLGRIQPSTGDISSHFNIPTLQTLQQQAEGRKLAELALQSKDNPPVQTLSPAPNRNPYTQAISADKNTQYYENAGYNVDAKGNPTSKTLKTRLAETIAPVNKVAGDLLDWSTIVGAGELAGLGIKGLRGLASNLGKTGIDELGMYTGRNSNKYYNLGDGFGDIQPLPKTTGSYPSSQELGIQKAIARGNYQKVDPLTNNHFITSAEQEQGTVLRNKWNDIFDKKYIGNVGMDTDEVIDKSLNDALDHLENKNYDISGKVVENFRRELQGQLSNDPGIFIHPSSMGTGFGTLKNARHVVRDMAPWIGGDVAPISDYSVLTPQMINKQHPVAMGQYRKYLPEALDKLKLEPYTGLDAFKQVKPNKKGGKIMKTGGTTGDFKNNPYKLQHGGKPPVQLLKMLYDNLYSEDKPDTESENIPEENTAPSTEELQATDENQGEVIDPNYDMAMQAAMGNEYDPAAGNPYAVGMPENPTGAPPATHQMGVNPYAAQTRSDILGSYPSVSDLGIWGDKAHQGRVSDHNTGDAEDFGIKDPETGNRLVGQLQEEARQRNIKYIIYNHRIWNPSISTDWRPYNGPDPHDTHVHISYNRKQGGYKKGGTYTLSHDDLAELKNQGYKFTLL